MDAVCVLTLRQHQAEVTLLWTRATFFGMAAHQQAVERTVSGGENGLVAGVDDSSIRVTGRAKKVAPVWMSHGMPLKFCASSACCLHPCLWNVCVTSTVDLTPFFVFGYC